MSFPLGSTIEVSASDLRKFPSDQTILEARSPVFLPHLPGRSVDDLRWEIGQVRQLGFQPVPHLAARHYTGSDELREHLDVIRESGVKTAFALAGDRPDSAGSLKDSMDILRFTNAHGANIQHWYVSGYPEGHPTIPDRQITQALLEKNSYFAEVGADYTIVTQFAFDASAYVRLVRNVRKAGITAPIRLGVAGVTSIPTLIRYAKICGIGQSLSFLTKRSGAVLKLVKGFTPGDLIEEIGRGLSGEEMQNIGIHYFPFGGARKTLEWIKIHSQNAN